MLCITWQYFSQFCPFWAMYFPIFNIVPPPNIQWRYLSHTNYILADSLLRILYHRGHTSRLRISHLDLIGSKFRCHKQQLLANILLI